MKLTAEKALIVEPVYDSKITVAWHITQFVALSALNYKFLYMLWGLKHSLNILKMCNLYKVLLKIVKRRRLLSISAVSPEKNETTNFTLSPVVPYSL